MVEYNSIPTILELLTSAIGLGLFIGLAFFIFTKSITT